MPNLGLIADAFSARGWGYVAPIRVLGMVQTLSATIAFTPERKVTHLCLAGDASFLAWAEQGGKVSLAPLEDHVLGEVSGVWNNTAAIVGLCSRGNRVFALDELNGLTCLDAEGEVAWFYEVPGGGFSLHQGSENMAVVDALGRLHLIGYGGANVEHAPSVDGILKACFINEALVLSCEDGTVQVIRKNSVVWRRPVRGDVGESITALGTDADGHLVLGREGYALVDGDEEALEMEVWCLRTFELIHRTDLKTRLTHCTPGASGVVCGFDDGLVSKFSNGVFEEILRTNYAIQEIVVSGANLIVSSWFYLFGHRTDEGLWKIEHQGMPTQVLASNNGKVCFFAGDDQNDWTDPEPIGYFRLDESLLEVDPTELTEWFQKGSIEPQLSAEEIYRIDDSVEKLLTEEERSMVGGSVGASIESLQDALGDLSDELDDATADLGTLNVDAEGLFEAMNDELSNMALLPDEDLFDALNESVVAPIAPIPKAGEDRTVACDSDGTSVVLLDGLGSEDVQNRIVMWSWVDDTGKEIASQPQVKVRLDAGVHRFELRICDSDGRWSSDSIQVTLTKA